MRRSWLALVCVAGLAGMLGGIAIMLKPATEPAPAKALISEKFPTTTKTQTTAKAQASANAQTKGQERKRTWVQATWQPPAGFKQSPLWPKGAPDMKGVPLVPERIERVETPEALHGPLSEAVWDVSSPTMTVFPPQGKNSGAAMVVFPGGGFRALAITLEGTEICHWIASKGMTCILSKYRVPKSNHYWDSDCKCHITPKVPRALQDAQRTIRLVRASAKKWNIDPGKIGVMGFSAGGYLVAQTSNIFTPAYAPVDATDKVSSRPDFAVAFFPGHLCRAGATLGPGIRVTKQTPPTFLLQAWDDPVDEICNSTVYARALDDARVPAEVHLFAKGGHAFGLRKTGHPVVDAWPSLLEIWLKEIGILSP